MPRALRIHVPGAFYHVTLRGNHRQNIFFGPADRQLLNEIVAEVIERFEARVHAFCWMTNHIHLLVQISETPLGRIMLQIASRYARTVQKHLHTTGHLFERRYHSILVDADEYLLELLRYIHLNPVRARMVDDAVDYPWSSHHAYLGGSVDPWVTTDFALSMFHRERACAIAAYDRFVHEEPAGPESSPFAELNTNDARVLGSDQFLARSFGASWQPRPCKTIDDLTTEACEQFHVSLDELRSLSRKSHLTRARAWIAHQALLQGIASISAVARRLNRDESSLRYAVERYGDSLT